MGIKAPGNSSRGSAPYSRVFTSFGAAIDLTEASVTVIPTTNSTGSRHGASGVILYLAAAGVFTYRDAAGVQSAITFVAGDLVQPQVPIPIAMSEISSFTGAGNRVLAYWHD